VPRGAHRRVQWRRCLERCDLDGTIQREALMRTTAIRVDDMQVLLDVSRRDGRVITQVIIGKSSTAPPIPTDLVSVVLETAGGPLLTPVSSPPPGVLPEAHTRGATASGQFTFEADPDTKLNRAIVFLSGNRAEFKLS